MHASSNGTRIALLGQISFCPIHQWGNVCGFIGVTFSLSQASGSAQPPSDASAVSQGGGGGATDDDDNGGTTTGGVGDIDIPLDQFHFDPHVGVASGGEETDI